MSFDYDFMSNINTTQHYFGKAGCLLRITMEARNNLTQLNPIVIMSGAGKYNKGRTDILKLSYNDT